MGDSCRLLSHLLTAVCPVPDSLLSPGVSLRSRAKGRLPIPMVILPFMKHGDLHAFLLASRIGENPFVSAWGGLAGSCKETKTLGESLAWWAAPIKLVRKRGSLASTLLMLEGFLLPHKALLRILGRARAILGEETSEAPFWECLDSGMLHRSPKTSLPWEAPLSPLLSVTPSL